LIYILKANPSSASSLADKENELVVFSAVSNKPNPTDVIQRIALNEKEANDVDILEPTEGSFKIAYCQDYAVYIQDIDYDFEAKRPKSLRSPAKKYEVPQPDTYEKAGRSKLRSIRWLSPSHLLLVVNKPKKSGVQLEVLRIYENGMGSISWRKSLPRSAKAAVDADVARLDSDASGAYQMVVAVATIDVALHFLTVDYHGTAKDSLSNLRPYDVYKDVHPLQMTKVVFSPFLAPEAATSSQSRPQYLRLASTSLGNTISVETFELKSSGKRHILSSSTTQTLYNTMTSLAGVFIVLCLGLMIQSLLDPAGNWTKSLIPAGLRNTANVNGPGVMYDGVQKAKAATDGIKAPAAKTSQRIRDILHLHRPESNQENSPHEKALVIHHDPEADGTLSTEVHGGHEEVVKRHTEAKTWDNLSHEQQKRWKDKLVDAGMWTVEEGETILKSIFFSEAGGLVGRVAEAVING
jgi:prolactin regulatory element-binding protein